MPMNQTGISAGEGKRQVNMDLLRILACLMVIVQHTAANSYYAFGVGNGWLAANFFETVIRPDIPIFFMLSGCMFLNREKPVYLPKFLGKNTLRLFTVYLVWSIFYALDVGGYLHRSTFRWESWNDFHAFLYQALSDSKYHLWFMPTMIAVYLIVPVLYQAVNSEGGKILEYLVVMFFVLTVLPQMLGVFLGADSIIVLAIGKFFFPLGGSYGYFALGAYLARQDFRRYRKRYILLAYIAVSLAHFGVSSWHAYSAGYASEYMFDSNSIFVLLESSLLFILFQSMADVNFPSWLGRLSREVAACTLGIYMIHILVLEKVGERAGGLLLKNSYTALSVPVTVAAVFGISLVCVFIMRRIPFVRDWFV